MIDCQRIQTTASHKSARATTLRRVVAADDVAETMMSLIQSNRFVTGEIVVIDGGFTAST